MNDVLDVLGEAITPKAVAALARELGLDAGDARRLVAAIAPLLLERLGDNARGGDAGNIAAALTKDHDGSLVDAAADYLGGRFRSGPGAAILGHVFGGGLDVAVGQVAESTGLPEPAVRLGFQALAPIAMAALTKAAIGAITAAVVVKLLDVAVDGIRTGKVQRVLGAIDDRLDRDGDGRSVDDVGRGALHGVRAGGRKLVAAGRKVRANPKVRSAAAKSAKSGKRAAAAGAKQAAKQGRKLMKKLFGR